MTVHVRLEDLPNEYDLLAAPDLIRVAINAIYGVEIVPAEDPDVYGDLWDVYFYERVAEYVEADPTNKGATRRVAVYRRT